MIGSCVAIDPGPEQSALVDFRDWAPQKLILAANPLVLAYLKTPDLPPLVIEKVTSYGRRPVGDSTFETVFWSGKFAQEYGGPCNRISRPRVCTHLCGAPNAGKPQVRQVLIDRYGKGGGRKLAIGTAGEPGLLYGVKTHLWDALALAVVWCEIQHQRQMLAHG